MKKPAITKSASRSTEGLRDVLFEELDKLRASKCTPAHANAIAKVCDCIMDTSRLEIEVAKLINRAGEAKEVRSLTLSSGNV